MRIQDVSLIVREIPSLKSVDISVTLIQLILFVKVWSCLDSLELLPRQQQLLPQHQQLQYPGGLQLQDKDARKKKTMNILNMLLNMDTMDIMLPMVKATTDTMATMVIMVIQDIMLFTVSTMILVMEEEIEMVRLGELERGVLTLMLNCGLVTQVEVQGWSDTSESYHQTICLTLMAIALIGTSIRDKSEVLFVSHLWHSSLV